MRKGIFLILLVTITNYSFGQKFSLGSELGIISSINTESEGADFENRRNTYYTGFKINYNFNDLLSLSTGFHYLRQGYKNSIESIFGEGSKNELIGKIDYHAIPILANIHFLKSRKIIVSLGFLASFNSKAIQESYLNIGDKEVYSTSRISEYTKDKAYFGIVSAGFKLFENDKVELISSIKYYQGLTDIYINPLKDDPYLFDLFNIERKFSSTLLCFIFNYKL